MPRRSDSAGYLPFDLGANLENAWLLCHAVSGLRPEPNAKDLKRAYGVALNELQHSRLPFHPDSLLVTFDDQDVLYDMLRERLLEPADLEADRHVFADSERPTIISKIADALEYIRAVDPNLEVLIRQLVGVVPVFKQAKKAGGSVSTLTGLIWLNPLPGWTVVDYAEAIVHEYIHNSIFLADAVRNVFRYPIEFTAPDNLVVSAIRKIPRPYDKSFHSAVVAHGLRDFLTRAHQEARAEHLAQGLKPTLAGLSAKPACLAAQGRLILEALDTELAAAVA
jgi:hypothetical protein